MLCDDEDMEKLKSIHFGGAAFVICKNAVFESTCEMGAEYKILLLSSPSSLNPVRLQGIAMKTRTSR